MILLQSFPNLEVWQTIQVLPGKSLFLYRKFFLRLVQASAVAILNRTAFLLVWGDTPPDQGLHKSTLFALLFGFSVNLFESSVFVINRIFKSTIILCLTWIIIFRKDKCNFLGNYFYIHLRCLLFLFNPIFVSFIAEELAEIVCDDGGPRRNSITS